MPCTITFDPATGIFTLIFPDGTRLREDDRLALEEWFPVLLDAIEDAVQHPYYDIVIP